MLSLQATGSVMISYHFSEPETPQIYIQFFAYNLFFDKYKNKYNDYIVTRNAPEH